MESVLPIHIAVHHLGCARLVKEQVAVSSRMGPHIEALAEVVGRVSVLAYDPPARQGFEDLTDYVIRPHRGDVRLVSLGPKATRRALFSRRRRVAAIVSKSSRDWDLLLLRLPNRRVGEVLASNRCGRLFALATGHGPSVWRQTKLSPLTKLETLASSLVAESYQQRLIRTSGVAAVNSEELLVRYRNMRSDLALVRTTGRRRAETFVANDRFERDTVDIMVAGRLSAPKGVFDALDAFAKLRAVSPRRMRLHFVGTGEAESSLVARSHELDLKEDVVFHGWVPSGPDLYALYRSMDVLMLLTYAESFPRTVWEAMANSVLVVCTPAGGIVSTLRDGADVLLVPPRNPDAAAAAIMRLSDDAALRKRLITNGLSRARDVTVEATAEHIVRLAAQRWPELESRRLIP